MTDTLRTRIAKVLYEQFGSALGAHPEGWDREPGGTQEMYLEDADAVIRELDDVLVDWGLWLAEEITGRTMTRLDMESCLTDWKANDE